MVPASLARVLKLESELISRLELIVVDDCSDDGSWEILEQIVLMVKCARAPPRQADRTRKRARRSGDSGPGRDPGAATSGLIWLVGCCARAPGAVHHTETTGGAGAVRVPRRTDL